MRMRTIRANTLAAIAVLIFFGMRFSWAQSPAQQLDAYVNEFSGNFNYSVPLMAVPGPNGESFPLVAQYYTGGIGMNQQASWIGLGWNLSIGQISRGMKGFPDDYNGGRVTEKTVLNVLNSNK